MNTDMDPVALTDIAQQVLASIDAGNTYTHSVQAWMHTYADTVGMVDPATADRMRGL